MMLDQAAKPSHTRNAGHQRIQPAPKWLAVGRVVVWACLVIGIEVAVGNALQHAAVNTTSHADANELAPPVEVLSAQGTCPALDQYVHRDLTIDELHDLQDQLCPTSSEPQRTGN